MPNNKPIGVAYEDPSLNGATIDNSVIGGTTPTSATFTTMTCTTAIVGGSTLSGTELGYVDGITPGTVTASKSVVVDANKDIAEFRNLTATNHIVGVGGSINSDSGTASATDGAATLSKMAGVVTTEALTTAAGAAYTLTLTNTAIAAADIVFASVANGTNAQGVPVVGVITPGAGSCTIVVRNEDAAAAFNGTLVISFLVIKA